MTSQVVRHRWPRREVQNGPATMWRYAPVLPPAPANVVSLGEGWTPLIRTAVWAARIGAEHLWVKDEGLNPTGSFKARGLACADIDVRRNWASGRSRFPPPGNAASAMAAYAAAAGIEAHIFMPRDVPQVELHRVQGLRRARHSGRRADQRLRPGSSAERGPAEGWFDVSTLKEPYRIEGKKTMGYEVAEQLDWELPDAIFYPTGGGVGMIGMWKAFEEMEKLGWIGAERPKMIAVQAEGCQPVVRAFEQNEHAQPVLGERPDRGRRAARSQAAGRFPDAQRRSRERRHGHRGQRRGDARRRHPTGRRRRHVRRARRAPPASPPLRS